MKPDCKELRKVVFGTREQFVYFLSGLFSQFLGSFRQALYFRLAERPEIRVTRVVYRAKIATQPVLLTFCRR